MSWYPSVPTSVPASGPASGPASYRPTAGPLADSPGLSEGRVVRFGLGRTPLVSALLFGVAPLLLVGVIVVGYLVYAPHKTGPASRGAFQAAGVLPSNNAPVAQDASVGPASASPSAMPSPSAKPSPSPLASALPGNLPASAVAVSPTSKPTAHRSRAPKPAPSKATPSSSAPPSLAVKTVVPTDLGAPNVSGYCASLGEGTAENTTGTADGWSCSTAAGLPLSMQAACAWSYSISPGNAIDVDTDYSSPSGVQCWLTNGVLGMLSFTAYCSEAGLGTATLTAQDANGWSCTDEKVINTLAACQLMYHSSDVFARFEVWDDPYSWQCWH